LADHDIKQIPESLPESEIKSINENNAKQKRRNEKIESVCEDDSLFWMRPNFESELGLPKNESEKIDKAMEKFAQATKDDIPPSLTAPIEFLIAKVSP